MNSLSKVQKCGIILMGCFLILNSASAALTYDPDTGTYTDDSIVDDGNSIWIPVQTEEELAAEAEALAAEEAAELEMEDEIATDPVAVVAEPVVISEADFNSVDRIPVDESEPELEEVMVTEVVDAATGAIAVVTEPVLLVTFDENDPIIQVETQASTAMTAVNTAELEGMLTDGIDMLSTYLDQKASDLAGIYNENISDKYGQSFSEILSCIGDDNAIIQIQNEIQSIVTTLDQRIKTDSATVYSQIATLLYKENIGLVQDDALAIETTVIATNIEAFNQNFISLIDYYADEAASSITDFVSTQEAAEYDAILAMYLARKIKLDQLKQAFTAFEKGSFFSQTVVGPRADDLEALSSDIFEIFENDLRAQWANRDPKAFDALISQFRISFDAKVDASIDMLFPYGNIDGVYKSYTSLADIYGLNKSEYSCQAVITNDTVDTAGTTLITSIDAIQQEMAVAMSAVGGATSWMELQEGLSTILLEYYQTDLLTQYKAAYDTAEIIELSEEQQLMNSYTAQVTSFLLNLRLSYADNNNILGFETKLERAFERIDAAIADGAEGRLLLILQAIRAAVIQVLQG